MQLRIIIVISLCLGNFVFSQSSKAKKADKLFAARAYVKAAELYEQVPESPEVLQNLGDCYYFNGFMDKAANVYRKALNPQTEDKTKLTYFRLAHALYGINEVQEADSIMSLYKTSTVDSPKLKNSLKLGAPFTYTVDMISSGNSEGDFALGYYGDQVSFASLRSQGSKTYKWNEKPYLDIFIADYTEDGTLENITALPKTINSNTHESNAVLSKDGKTLYFSRTNNKRNIIDEQKVAVVKLYKAIMVDGEWSNIEELPFSSNLYSALHPTLNGDDTKLYFSSDMPGGYGSFDIYFVDISSEGQFGEPINLGSTINTAHREQFPFISQDSTLYFTSDGLQGFGGLDIFMCEQQKANDTFSTPLNLGEKINTGKDDFAFVVDSDNNTGFLSSNRSGSDNLYHFTRKNNERSFIVEGTVRDKNSNILLPETMITLFDKNNNAIDSVMVGVDGRYKFYTKPSTAYKIDGFKPLYIPTVVGFDTDDSGKIELNIELELESYDDAEDIVVEKDGYVFIQLENIYFELDKWNIEPQAATTLNVLVDLMKKYPRMEVKLSAHTDTRSTYEYNMTLSNNRAKSAMEYIISRGINRSRLTSEGYGETQLLIDCGEDCSEDEHSINRRCEFMITK